jgi:hypothetical protein
MAEVAAKGFLRGVLIGFCLLGAGGAKVEAVRYLLYLICVLGGFFTGFGYLIKDSLMGLLGDFIGALGAGAGYFGK